MAVNSGDLWLISITPIPNPYQSNSSDLAFSKTSLNIIAGPDANVYTSLSMNICNILIFYFFF